MQAQFRWRACGSAKPSKTGTICVTPSPASTTTPVSSPCVYKRAMLAKARQALGGMVLDRR
eukprot:1382274-Pleurochrysis_carterae.AAC.1